MLTVSGLYIYPVKSLGGVAVDDAMVTERGLKYDRCWMLVDESNRFISQREFAVLALLQVFITGVGLRIVHRQNNDEILIAFSPEKNEFTAVIIWDDICFAQLVSDAADKWFSEMIEMPCRLVYMPEETRRMVDNNYAFNEEITAFSDGYPCLVISEASLQYLNKRLPAPVLMNRFRPNIVLSGAVPYEEDELAHFAINSIDFFGVKLCSRCTITTIDQLTAYKGKEPLKTLAAYRTKDNKTYFGQNLLHKGGGIIKVGDIVTVIDRKEPAIF